MTLPHRRRSILGHGAPRLMVHLALVGSLGLMLASGTPAQAARPHNLVPCLGCYVPPISVTSDYWGNLTVSGQNFTPAGLVQIVASMPLDGMGGGGVTTVTTQASSPGWTCTRLRCVYSAGGTFVTTFSLTFSCGGGMSLVTVQAQDVATGAWSNRVTIFPWMYC